MAFASEFSIESTRSPAQTTIRVTGELDSATSAQLSEHFERARAEHVEATGVVLDLRELSFIDSAGIRTIVLIQRAAAGAGLELVMHAPPAEVMELLELSGIAARIALVPGAEPDSGDPTFLGRQELQLARERTTPARARAEVRAAVGERASRRSLDAVTLLTSELVTNAVLHPDPAPGDPVTLSITSYADRIRVEVTDPGPGFDPSHRPEPTDEGGRGLRIVDAIATRWGTRRESPGPRFTVWFEFVLNDA